METEWAGGPRGLAGRRRGSSCLMGTAFAREDGEVLAMGKLFYIVNGLVHKLLKL